MDNLIRKVNDTGIYVMSGDITQVTADAIVTPINSEGMWFGGVDRAIQRVARNLYHSQAAKKMPLTNLQTVVAKGSYKDHGGRFNNVVFVVDDLQSPLSQVMFAGLEASHKEGYNKILLPTMRLGVMTGAFEKTEAQTLDQIALGVNNFLKKYQNNSIRELGFVVYQNPKLATSLANKLK